MNAQDKQHLDKLIHSARIVVRETGWIAAEVDYKDFTSSGCPGGREFKSACLYAYDMACAHLTQLDPAGAAEFIRSTYGPLFRQTEVTTKWVKWPLRW